MSYWIKDENGKDYGCYDTFDEAAREIDKLIDDPFSGVSWNTDFEIVCE